VKNKQLRVMIATRLILGVILMFISWQATIRNGISVPVANSDKVLHFLAFYTLSLLVDFAFPLRRFGAIKIITLIGYGLLIEVVQSFLPYRSADMADLLTDIVGIAAYAATIPLLRRFSFYQQYRQM
jgi:VanZ family protein